MRPRVKICCIQSAEEAALAVAWGADAIGLVAAMPSGPGVIDEARIACIAPTVPRGVGTFLLTSEREPARITAQHRRCGTNTIQLCDHLEAATHRALRAAMAGVVLVQVVHVTGPESIAYALEAAATVDALLLDSGNPALAVKELGGTGRMHDWATSRAIRDAARVPVYLAGGLRPENVARAIATVAPFGLDLCTGVRTEGRLDAAKLAAFFAAIGSASAR